MKYYANAGVFFFRDIKKLAVTTKKARAIIFIDGNNFYHGMKIFVASPVSGYEISTAADSFILPDRRFFDGCWL